MILAHGYRGPEQHLESQDSWLPTLTGTPTYGGLTPAIVTNTNPQSLEILFADGSTATLDWENGLKGLRKHITQNRRSAPIKSAEELFKVGDLIRTTLTAEGSPQLAQLPEAEAANRGLES